MADTVHGSRAETLAGDSRRLQAEKPANDEAFPQRPDSDRLTPEQLTRLQALGGNAAAARLVAPIVQRMTAAPTAPAPTATPGPTTGPAPATTAAAATPATTAPPPAPTAPTAAPTAGPVPTLTALPGAKFEGPCGNFERRRTWRVANPVQGIIVQKIDRTFNVHSAAGPLAGAALDAYVTDPGSSVHATQTTYWEAWTVDATGAVSDDGEDTF